jgi:lipopolysaccharide transport system ATP-binding protein
MTDKNIAIRVSHLGKKYQIGGPQEKYLTLRDAIVNSVKAPFKRFHPAPSAEEFWALKDVSFDVEPGEVVGIIGRNGAGKSTLLKILSRITTPTEGTVELHGRVGSLLEVGTGFHPEMTGRENIFLNGSILGMKRSEIDQKLDEIVKFSEIEKFLDTPVKRYSSGMYVRLAFAVAAHLEPEILVVDEVLAVGDAQFQKKCLGKMGAVAKEGRTVLFVSHNMEAIRKLCPRSILIDSGKIKHDGVSLEVIECYLHNGRNNNSAVFLLPQKTDAQISVYKTIDPQISVYKAILERIDGTPSASFKITEPWQIRLFVHFDRKIENVSFGLGMMKNGSSIRVTYSHAKTFEPGEHQLVFREKLIWLTPGFYQFNLRIRSYGNVIAGYSGIGPINILDITSNVDNLYKINVGIIVNPMEVVSYD